MAEILDEQDEQDTESKDGIKKRRKNRFLEVFLVVVRYLLLVLLLIGLSVVVTVITVNALQNQRQIQNSSNVFLDIEQSVPEDLDWYSTLGEIRGNLLDEGRKTFIVDLYLGYLPGDQGVLQELIRRNVQIKERITLYFSSHYYNEVQGARNLIKMKNELREIINRMMTNKIREVAFNNLQVIEF